MSYTFSTDDYNSITFATHVSVISYLPFFVSVKSQNKCKRLNIIEQEFNIVLVTQNDWYYVERLLRLATACCFFIKAQRSGPSTLSTSIFHFAMRVIRRECLSMHCRKYPCINHADSFIIDGYYGHLHVSSIPSMRLDRRFSSSQFCHMLFMYFSSCTATARYLHMLRIFLSQ